MKRQRSGVSVAACVALAALLLAFVAFEHARIPASSRLSMQTATPTVVLHPDLPPTSLHVVRTFDPNIYVTTALDATITDAPSVQRLYTAALALHPEPENPICAKDISVEYHLTFFNGTDIVSQMVADDSACLVLVINGGLVPRMETRAFLDLLAQTIGVAELY